jgi:methionyl-tRNA formyltransferase
MSRVRIVFLGTPEFAAASLATLIADEHFEIVGVISQPDRPAGRKMQLRASPVKELATQHGLVVFTPSTVNTPEFREQIAALGAEAAAVVAFGQILGQKFIDLFPRGCVNVHGSILPRWRGAAPIQRALMAGDTQGGVALQVLVKKLDAGPVLGIRRVEIDQEINAAELHDRLKVLGAELLHVEFMDYIRGHLQPIAQEEDGITYAHKIDKAEAHLDWTKSAEEVHNRVRGLALGPAAFVRCPQILKIHKTRVAEAALTDSPEAARGATVAPGEITTVTAQSFTVACSQGLLEVLEVQPESRSRQSVAEYLRGHPLKVGDRFS